MTYTVRWTSLLSEPKVVHVQPVYGQNRKPGPADDRDRRYSRRWG